MTNKHLLPVGRYPMIYHPVAKLAAAGIHDILIVTGTEHMGSVVGVLGSGRVLGLEFTYRVQDEAGGIAQALSLAEGFVGDGRCVVILGDNIFSADIAPFVDRFRRQPAGARVLLKQVPDPQRYGVAVVENVKEDSGDPAALRPHRILRIEEKPVRPQSDLAVTGIYMYDSQVFEIIRTLHPSARGELEITDVNNAYLRQGQLEYDILDGWWTDAGTHSSWSLANRLARDMVLPIFEENARYRVGASAQEIAATRFVDPEV